MIDDIITIQYFEKVDSILLSIKRLGIEIFEDDRLTTVEQLSMNASSIAMILNHIKKHPSFKMINESLVSLKE